MRGIIGLGTDVTLISRFSRLLGNSALQDSRLAGRILHPAELREFLADPSPPPAARFLATRYGSPGALPLSRLSGRMWGGY